MDVSALERASQVLLEATGFEGQFAQFVRDPITGETGLVLAVRGNAVDEMLDAMRARRPSLARRVLRSLAGA